MRNPFQRKRGHFRSRSHKSFLKPAFIAAAIGAQVLTAGVIGYAAYGGDMDILKQAGFIGLTSIFGGAAGAISGGAVALGLVKACSSKDQSGGLADTAAFAVIGGAAMTAGYIGGAIGAPMLFLP